MAFSGTDILAAYAAGLLDGEGCVRVGRKQTPLGERYFARVVIAMTEKKVIDFLVENFGGNVYSEKITSRQVVHRWTLSKKPELEYFLKAVLPYLLVKKKQANLALDFYADDMRDTRVMDEDELSRRRNLSQESSRLNAVGVLAVNFKE